MSGLLLVSVSLMIGAQPQQTPLKHAAASNAVPDLRFEQFGPGYHLVWSYQNTGDYDQNGEVNIADLTPIGTYFGAVEGEAGWAQARVADGDGNGEVNIADITPIGDNFSSSVSGYRIYAAASADGPWEPLADITLTEAKEELIEEPILPVGGPVTFIYLLGDSFAELHYYVIPLVGSIEGTLSEVLSFNTDPASVASVAPQSGFSGDLVEFNAETQGQLLSYSWDFGGGGEPNTSTIPRPWVYLGIPGEYTVMLTVDNEFGPADQYVFVLNIAERTGMQADVRSVSPFGGASGAAVTFIAEVIGTQPISYSWEFGGGASPNTSTAVSPTVTLGAPGFYLSTLIISNDQGPESEFQFMLTVE